MTTTDVISPDLKTVLRRLKLSRMLDTLPERLTLVRIPAKLNAQSGHSERGFRASRTLIGAKRRRQWVL